MRPAKNSASAKASPPRPRPLVWVAQGWWVEEVFEGILEAAIEYGWDLDYSMRHVRAGIFAYPERADGVIVYTGPCSELIPRIRSMKVPVMDMESYTDHYSGAPKVIVSNTGTGEHAALHLAAGDPDRLIFLGPEIMSPMAEARLAGFREGARKAGLRAEFVPLSRFDPVELTHRGRAGVFGMVDSIAIEALRRCAESKIRVPHRMAILGANDADPGALLVKPALSSVAIARRLQGRRAADLLNRMMTGVGEVPLQTEVPVAGVRVRGSTHAVKTGDPTLDSLIRHFRENAHRPETVAVFCEECGVPERTAARLVAKLGVSPRELLAICRLHLAQRFSIQAKLTTSGIAAASGFGGLAGMNRARRAGLPSAKVFFAGI